MVQAPAATSVTVVPDTVQTAGVAGVKLTARPDDAVALTVKGGAPNTWLDSVPKEMLWAANPFCVTAICRPSTVMCAVRADADVFAANEKPMTPLAMVPMVSQLWSLAGAKIPARDIVEGSTGSSESDPAEEGSDKLAGPVKAYGISLMALL
jgi:hypothetical protein